MNRHLTLPPQTGTGKRLDLTHSGQLTIIGANGAGKTRFMNYMVEHAQFPTMVLSAATAFFPSRATDPSSTVDKLYKEKIAGQLRDDTKPQLEKLIQMLLHDEFSYLLKVKSDKLFYNKPIHLEPTRLDLMVKLWQDIFPGNQIIRRAGTMMFATESGDNLIGSAGLSSGERAVLYYIAGVLYAEPESMICIDNPSMFLHPAILNALWNAIEGLRPDCTFVYNTSDIEFVNSRTGNTCVWVRSQNVQQTTWDYQIIGKGALPEELFVNIIGTRRPVLFIEGDAVHSIDAKLYPLVFRRYTVRPLGSCNKVIESTRAFSDLKNIHQLDSRGLVDRDRRTDDEVAYLRRKNILVPEVAEIENIFLAERVVRIMAAHRRRNPDRVFSKVRTSVLRMFASHFREQVLMHVRHRMKRALECRGDSKADSIGALEQHLRRLPEIINVRSDYDELMRRFGEISRKGDYAGVLKVFNHKPMLSESRVANLLGYNDKEDYIAGVLGLLKSSSPLASEMRRAMLDLFNLEDEPA